MDFIFKFQGGLNQKEFKDRTKVISSFPTHLKYSLFQNNKIIKQVQKKNFLDAFFPYDEIKEKGNRAYRKKNYREAIDYYYLVTHFFITGLLDNEMARVYRRNQNEKNNGRLFE